MTGRLLQSVLRQAEAMAANAGPGAVPDAELLARFVRLRDEPAFAVLVRRHGPMVWAVCRHLLPNPADAEDAFQATFLALVRSAAKVRNGSALGAWLHGVAVKASLKLKRSAVRRKQREERAAGPEADRSVPEGTWDELLAAVHEEVSQLPETLRTAFVLCDLEGVRQPDAAVRLGWKPGTLTGRLTKARQRLLARLADRGIAAGAVAIGAAAAGAAVPAELAGRVLSLTTATVINVSPTVWQLALEVTPMTVNKTKLLAACVLVTGGLGIGVGAAVLPNADAQGPPAGAEGLPLVPSTTAGTGTDAGEPGQAGGAGNPFSPTGAGTYDASKMGMSGMEGMMGSGAPAHQRWEYKFENLPGSVDAFRKLLTKLGQEGWEFAGDVVVNNAPAKGRGIPGSGGVGDLGGYPGDEADAMPGGEGGYGGVSGSPMGGMPGGRDGRVLLGGIPSKSLTQLVFKRLVQRNPTRAGSGMMSAPGGMPGMAPGGVGRGGSGRRGGGSLQGGSPPPGAEGMGGAMIPGRMAPSMGAGAPRTAGGFEVLALKHATAAELSTTITQLFPGDVQMVPDKRTNSLIIKASAETMKEVKELIQKLDVADPPAGRSGGDMPQPVVPGSPMGGPLPTSRN